MKHLETTDWEELIQSYRNSGIGLDKWCKLNNVSKGAMSYRLYGNKRKKDTPSHVKEIPQLMEFNLQEYLIQPSMTIRLGKLEITVDHDNMDMVSQLLKMVIYD